MTFKIPVAYTKTALKRVQTAHNLNLNVLNTSMRSSIWKVRATWGLVKNSEAMAWTPPPPRKN